MNTGWGEVAKRSPLQRLRFQLGGSLLFAALLPYVIRAATISSPPQLVPVNQALIGSILAIVVGTWLFRNVSTYPGIEKTAYVLPAFTMSYTALLLFFIMSRLDYNRTILLTGYTISVTWFMIIHSHLQRRAELKVGVLPFGDSTRLEEIQGITWIPLRDRDRPPTGLDAIAADLRTDLPADWDRRLADFALAGLPVYHTKHLIESLTGRVELQHMSENSFGSLAPVSAFMSFKAAVDWVTAAIGGLLLLPVFVAIALAIRMTSAGPALFRQQRIGYKGQPFTVYKFRTMTIARDSAEGARADAMTQHDDHRVTRLGRLLRHSRIDELPQIVNILRGEMSWIGPRPEAEILSRWYESEIPFYRYRHIVRPGITGWAQVCQGHVTELGEVQSKLHYDFYYIKHYSPWIDVLIIVRTVRTMLTGFGSR